MTLTELVVERRFNRRNHRHRRALLADELVLPADDSRLDVLLEAQELYRRFAGRRDRAAAGDALCRFERAVAS